MKFKLTPNNKENITIVVLLLLSLEYVIAYYTYQNISIAWVARISIVIIYCGFCLIPLFTQKRLYLNYRFVLLVGFLICLLWSAFRYMTVGTEWGILDGACMFAIAGGIWLSHYSLDVYEKLFRILSIIGILHFIYIMATNEISRSLVLSRQLIWTNIFYWSCVYWAIVPAVLLSVIKKRNIWFTVPYWICGVMNELLFQKRYIFIDSAILIVLVLFLLYKKGAISFNALMKIVIGIFISVGIGFVLLKNQFVSTAVEGVLARFQSINQISDVDRVRESRIYFSNVSLIDIIMGKGFWAAQSSLMKVNPALHIGWSNFVFKGGIIYLFMVAIPFLKAITKLPHIERYSDNSQYAILVVIAFSLRLFYTNYFSFQPELLFLSYGCVMVMCELNTKMK